MWFGTRNLTNFFLACNIFKTHVFCYFLYPFFWLTRLPMLLQARTYTISMPYRVQRIEEFVRQLDSGDLKLRVRVLEVPYFFQNFDSLFIKML